MDSNALITAQRALRQRLLDAPLSDGDSRGQRDLAAHLLLYLDDPQACWRMALGWLQQELDVDRVDGGFCAPTASAYQACAEATRRDREVQIGRAHV